MSKQLYGIQNPNQDITTSRPIVTPSAIDIPSSQIAYKEFIDLVSNAAQSGWVLNSNDIISLKTNHITQYKIQGMTGLHIALLVAQTTSRGSNSILPVQFYGLNSELIKLNKDITHEYNVVGWLPPEFADQSIDYGLIKYCSTPYPTDEAKYQYITNVFTLLNVQTIKDALYSYYFKFNDHINLKGSFFNDNHKTNLRILFSVFFCRAFEIDNPTFQQFISLKNLTWQTGIEATIIPKLCALASAFVDKILYDCKAYGYDVHFIMHTNEGTHEIEDFSVTLSELDGFDPEAETTTADSNNESENTKSELPELLDSVTTVEVESKPLYVDITTTPTYSPVNSDVEKLDHYATEGYSEWPNQVEDEQPLVKSDYLDLNAIFEKDKFYIKDQPMIFYPKENVDGLIINLWRKWRVFSNYFKPSLIPFDTEEQVRRKNDVNNELLNYKTRIAEQLSTIDNGLHQINYINEIAFIAYEMVETDKSAKALSDSLIKYLFTITPQLISNEDKLKYTESFQMTYSSMVGKISDTLKPIGVETKICRFIAGWWIMTYGTPILKESNMATLFKWMQDQDTLLNSHKLKGNISFYDEALALLNIKNNPEGLFDFSVAKTI